MKAAWDVSFSKGNSFELSSDNKPGRVLGSVLLGLKKLVAAAEHPDIIVFGALDKMVSFLKENNFIHA